MLTSFVVMFLVFAEMYRTGETTIRIVANRYGEFWIELVLYALGMLLLPVAVYEADLWLREE
jgi:hypothetical protein